MLAIVPAGVRPQQQCPSLPVHSAPIERASAVYSRACMHAVPHLPFNLVPRVLVVLFIFACTHVTACMLISLGGGRDDYPIRDLGFVEMNNGLGVTNPPPLSFGHQGGGRRVDLPSFHPVAILAQACGNLEKLRLSIFPPTQP